MADGLPLTSFSSLTIRLALTCRILVTTQETTLILHSHNNNFRYSTNKSTSSNRSTNMLAPTTLVRLAAICIFLHSIQDLVILIPTLRAILILGIMHSLSSPALLQTLVPLRNLDPCHNLAPCHTPALLHKLALSPHLPSLALVHTLLVILPTLFLQVPLLLAILRPPALPILLDTQPIQVI